MAKKKFSAEACAMIIFFVIWGLGFFGGMGFAVVSAIVIGANDYTRITAVNYRAEVIDNAVGTVRVTENVTYNIHCANGGIDENLEWEIWRDMPEDQNYDGVRVYYNVISVKRLNDDGSVAFELDEGRLLYEDESWSTWKAYKNTWYHSEGPYNEYYNRWECVIIYPGGVYREVQTYQIEYEIINGAMRYGDCSELYLSMFSGDSCKWLESFTAEILIPQNKMPAINPTNYTFNTFGTNSHTFAYTESDTENPGYHTFIMKLDSSQLKFKAYNRYLEFAFVTFGDDEYDKWSFTHKNVSSNRNYNTNVHARLVREQAQYDALPTTWMWVKLGVLVACIAAAALIIRSAYKKDEQLQKKYNFYRPELPFDKYMEIPSPLDPTFAGAFVMCKHKMTDNVPGGYAAAMLSLTRKGYITVEKIKQDGEWKESNVKIAVLKAEGERQKLTSSEELYFELIRRHAGDGEIKLLAFQEKVSSDYDNTNEFVRKTKQVVKSVGIAENYFQKPDYKRLKREQLTSVLVLLIVGVVLTVLLNCLMPLSRMDLAFGAFFIFGFSIIATAVLRYVLAQKYVLLTQKGEDEYAKWRGLYNFLNGDTLMKEQTPDRVEMWEDYLVYATAFGIPEKVLKALSVKYPDYVTSGRFAHSHILHHHFFHSHAFMHTSSRSFHGSTRSASRTGRFSGGGGYGGGGRGGGGGGGS